MFGSHQVNNKCLPVLLVKLRSKPNLKDSDIKKDAKEGQCEVRTEYRWPRTDPAEGWCEHENEPFKFHNI